MTYNILLLFYLLYSISTNKGSGLLVLSQYNTQAESVSNICFKLGTEPCNSLITKLAAWTPIVMASNSNRGPLFSSLYPTLLMPISFLKIQD